MPEYIEREAMWKEYQKCPVEFTPHGVVVDAYHVQKAIKTLPAADVAEVKHGEWITPTKIKSMTIAVPHCSVCGLVPCDKGLYCPNCGAKMDLKEGAENG